MPDTREALIEAMAKAEYETENAISGYHFPWNGEGWIIETIRLEQRKAAARRLAAIEAAGCVVVPRDATRKMLDEAVRRGVDVDWPALDFAYGHMLAASPFAPKEKPGA